MQLKRREEKGERRWLTFLLGPVGVVEYRLTDGGCKVENDDA